MYVALGRNKQCLACIYEYLLMIGTLHNVHLITFLPHILTFNVNLGACALHYAARAGNDKVCQQLLSSGADVIF